MGMILVGTIALQSSISTISVPVHYFISEDQLYRSGVKCVRYGNVIWLHGEFMFSQPITNNIPIIGIKGKDLCLEAIPLYVYGQPYTLQRLTPIGNISVDGYDYTSWSCELELQAMQAYRLNSTFICDQ